MMGPQSMTINPTMWFNNDHSLLKHSIYQKLVMNEITKNCIQKKIPFVQDGLQRPTRAI
jgi:hypothetical protein